jgi:hypothetical protein
MNVIAPLIDYALVQAVRRRRAPCRILIPLRYTFVFATVVCVVCALLVAGGGGLRPAGNQCTAVPAEERVGAGPVKPGEELSTRGPQDLRRQHTRRLVDLATGELVPLEAGIRRRTTSARRAAIPR